MSQTITRLVVWGTLAAMTIAAIVIVTRTQPILVDTTIATRGQLRVTVDEDGVTRIRERYIVSTPLSGRLERVPLEVGDQVRAGQTVLARMQPTDPKLLDPRAVAQAEARVSAADRRLLAAAADLKKSEAQLQFAEIEMGRQRKLAAQNATSPSEFQTAELLFNSRTEETRAKGFAVDIAHYELELERAALLLTDPDAGANEDGGYELTIKSPIDGRVLRLSQKSSAVLSAGQSIMELGDPSDLEVVTDVLSFDAVRVKAGAAVDLVNWGQPRMLQGLVRVVEPSGFTKLSALGVEEQRVNVIVDLVNPAVDRSELGDGFRVESRIVVWQEDEVLQIPTSAMFRVDGQWHVFVADQRAAKLTARLTPVQAGQTNGRECQITDGLADGDSVIVHPSDHLQDGSPIAVRSGSSAQ